MNVSRNTKLIRESLNYSQEYLAESIGWSQRGVSQFENGGDIPFSKLLKIADVLDVSIIELIGNEHIVFNLTHNKKANGLVINHRSKFEQKTFEAQEAHIESLKSENAHLKSVVDSLLKQTNKTKIRKK